MPIGPVIGVKNRFILKDINSTTISDGPTQFKVVMYKTENCSVEQAKEAFKKGTLSQYEIFTSESDYVINSSNIYAPTSVSSYAQSFDVTYIIYEMNKYKQNNNYYFEEPLVFSANKNDFDTNTGYAITIPPTVKGYFAYWTDEQGNKYNDKQFVKDIAQADDTITMEANWLRLCLNGGTIADDCFSIDSNFAITMTKEPTKSGYTFLGWSKGNSSQYSKNISITDLDDYYLAHWS